MTGSTSASDRSDVEHLGACRANGVAISVISLAELYEGTCGSTDPAARDQALQQSLRGVLALAVDETTARRFGQERGGCAPPVN